MKIFRTILFLSFVVTLSACATKKKVKTRPEVERPMVQKPVVKRPEIEKTELDDELGDPYATLEASPGDIELEMRKSELNLKYKLNKKSIVQAFNQVLDTLMNDNTIRIDEHNLDVTLVKKEKANIEFQEKSVLINFPIKITAEKETFLQKLLVEGELQLTAITDIEIDKYWNLFTTTELVDYSWIERPKAKMGSFSLPIEKIMNLLINRTKTKVVQEIDETIRKEFALKSQIISVMDMITKPFTIEETSNIDLQIAIDSFSMTGTFNTHDWTEGIISIKGLGEISGKKDYVNAPDDLPKFSWLDSSFEKDSSDLYFNIDLELDRINQFVSEKFVGQSFVEKGKEITINQIELKGLDEKLGVVADVSGSYNGQIFISATPKYDKETKSFLSEDIDISLLTKNALHKALGWMLQGRIKKELEKTLEFSLKDFLGPIQKQIDVQIKEINKSGEIDFTANLKDLDIEEFRFSKTKVHAQVHVPMVLELKVLNFEKLLNSN